MKGNGSNGNGHSNGNGKNGHAKLKPYVATLRPRPLLPSEYAQKLWDEREQVFAEISTDLKPVSIVDRLEKLIAIIDADDAAIPVQLSEEDDSLVIKVDEAKNGTNGKS